jgi:hypothetical protein
MSINISEEVLISVYDLSSLRKSITIRTVLIIETTSIRIYV